MFHDSIGFLRAGVGITLIVLIFVPMAKLLLNAVLPRLGLNGVNQYVDAA